MVGAVGHAMLAAIRGAFGSDGRATELCVISLASVVYFSLCLPFLCVCVGVGKLHPSTTVRLTGPSASVCLKTKHTGPWASVRFKTRHTGP